MSDIFPFSPSDPFPLTDEELIAQSLSVISDYVQCHPGSDINSNDCLDEVIKETKRIYWRCRKYSMKIKGAMSFGEFKPTEEYVEIFERIYDRLCERTSSRIRSLTKMRMMSEIKATTATALISEYMHEHGCKYYIETQTHRAKVFVKISKKQVMVFYVKYKDIVAGLLDEKLDSVMSIIKQITELNIEMQVIKARYASWIDWNE